MGGNGGNNKGLKKRASLLIFLLVFVYLLSPQSAHAGDGLFRGIFCSVISLFGNSCDVDFSGISVNPKKPAMPEVKSEHITQEQQTTNNFSENVTNNYNFYPVTVVSKPAAVQSSMAGADAYTDSYTKEWTPLALFYKQVDKIYDVLGDRVDDSIDNLEEELGTAFTTLSLTLTGALYDNNNSAGLAGSVLQSTGSGVAWVATSTLGITGGGGGVTSIEDLSDVAAMTEASGDLLSWNGTAWVNVATSSLGIAGSLDGSGSANRVAFWSDSNTLTSDSAFTFANSRLTVPVLNASGASTTVLSYNGISLLRASSTNRSLFLGLGAGMSNPSDAFDNIGIGYNALQSAQYENNTAVGNYALNSLVWGADNTAIGPYSLFSSQDDIKNIAIGTYALYTTNTGDSNIAIGYAAGEDIDGARENIFIGDAAGTNKTAGSRNVALGSQALYGGSGANNTAIGTYAINELTTGSNNIALGYEAGSWLTSGSNNIFIGYNIEAASTTASNRLNIGNLLFGTGIDGTGTTLSSGNIGIGTTTPYARFSVSGDDSQTLLAVVDESNPADPFLVLSADSSTGVRVNDNNIRITDGSGSNRILLQGNSGAPYIQLLSDTRINGAGSSFFNAGNVGIGTTTPSQELTVSGDLRLTGAIYDSNNSAGTLGYVLQSTAAGQQWVATSTLGFGSGTVTGTGSANRIAYWNGASSLTSDSAFTFANSRLTVPTFNASGASTTVLSLNNIPLLTASDSQASVGLGGYTSVLGADANSAFGYYALNVTTTGGYNTAIGQCALCSNTTGSGNTALGNEAMNNNISGDSNVAIGDGALYYNATGTSNIGIGYRGAEGITGSYNIGIGELSLWSAYVTSNQRNIAIGYQAGIDLEDGSDNIFIGYNAGDNLWTGSNNIIIGRNIAAPDSDGSGQLNIGNLLFGTDLDNTGTTISSGNIGIGTTTPVSKLSVAGRGYFTENVDALYFDVATSTGYRVAGVPILYSDYTGSNADFAAGAYALGSRVEGSSFENTALGEFALYEAATSQANVAVGYQAATQLLNGDYNTAVGVYTLWSATSSNRSTVLGYNAGGGARGSNNLLLGYNAGNSLGYGSNNIAIGYDIDLPNANNSNQLNIGNLLFGTGVDGTGTTLSTGNLGIGTTTPSTKLSVAGTGLFTGTLTSPTFNSTHASTTIVSINNSPFIIASSSRDTFVGLVAGTFSSPLPGTCDGYTRGSTGFGYNALGAQINGCANTAVGDSALGSAINIGETVAIGHRALASATSSGDFNVAVGTGALEYFTSGADNVALGYLAMNSSGYDPSQIQEAYANVAVGSYAMTGSGADASENTSVGYFALDDVEGDRNTGIGANAGSGSSLTGSNNLLLGYQTGNSLSSGSNNILIGYDIDLQNNTWSNRLNIGNLLFGTGIDGTGTTLSSGNIGIGTTTPDTTLTVHGSARLNVDSSGMGIFGRDISNNHLFSLTRESNNVSLTAYEGIGFAAGITTGPSSAYDMFVTSAGNVGIGTTTPASKLTVAGSVGGGLPVSADVINANSAGYGSVSVSNNNGAYGAISTYGSAFSISSLRNDAQFGSQNDIYISTNLDVGTGGTGDIYFTTGGYSVDSTVRAVITDQGRLGIGTSSPAVALDVNGSGYFHGNGTIISLNPYGAVSDQNRISITGNRAMFGYNGTSANAVIQAGVSKGIEFNVNNGTFGSGQAAVITSTGLLGIGTTTPNAQLEVVGSGSGLALELNNTGTGDGLRINTANAAANNGLLWYQGSDNVFNVFSNASNDGFMTLYDSGVGAVQLASNGSTYFNGGNVGIGTTSPAEPLHIYNATPSVRLQDTVSGASVVSVLNFYGADAVRTGYVGDGSSGNSDIYIGSEAGNINVTGTGGSCTLTGAASGGTCFSDERLKNVTGEIGSVLEGLTTLNLKKFYWNELAHEVTNASTTIENTGFLAQEVAAVFPELVYTNEDGYKTLDYTTLSLYGIVAINELEERTDFLEGASSTALLIEGDSEAFWSRLGELAQGFVDGVLTVTGLRTDELCITNEEGSTCINREQLASLLEGSEPEEVEESISGSGNDENDTGSDPQATSTASSTSAVIDDGEGEETATSTFTGEDTSVTEEADTDTSQEEVNEVENVETDPEVVEEPVEEIDETLETNE
jgi:hypothetical protein